MIYVKWEGKNISTMQKTIDTCKGYYYRFCFIGFQHKILIYFSRSLPSESFKILQVCSDIARITYQISEQYDCHSGQQQIPIRHTIKRLMDSYFNSGHEIILKVWLFLFLNSEWNEEFIGFTIICIFSFLCMLSHFLVVIIVQKLC